MTFKSIFAVILSLFPFAISAQSYSIEDYSDGEPQGMNHFYQRLDGAARASEPVRIGYFADSWIEADILTVDLREMLQDRFGGYGMGWVDCTLGMYNQRPTIGLRSSGITGYITTKKPFDASKQGIDQRYSIPVNGATMSLTSRSRAPHSSTWDRASFFFRAPNGITIGMTEGNDPTDNFHCSGSSMVQCLTLDADSMTNLKYRFSNFGKGTVLFGVALESAGGVTLDNLGVRSLQGYQLNSIPENTLSDFGKLRPYDLIIIHFGVNCISSRGTEAGYRNYTARMKQVIARFRRAYPLASILVMGLSDTGRSTLPQVPMLSRLERELAKDCKVSFFNLFDAMGGRGSLARYVANGWAARDYVHINFKGGKQIATIIFNAIMKGYNNRFGRSEEE